MTTGHSGSFHWNVSYCVGYISCSQSINHQHGKQRQGWKKDNDNNHAIPVHFSDAEKSMFDDTTEEFWKEAIRVCNEVERWHYGANATTITTIWTTTIQTLQTNQLKTSQTKQQKPSKKTMITNTGKKIAKVQRHQSYNYKPAVTQ